MKIIKQSVSVVDFIERPTSRRRGTKAPDDENNLEYYYQHSLILLKAAIEEDLEIQPQTESEAVPLSSNQKMPDENTIGVALAFPKDIRLDGLF